VLLSLSLREQGAKHQGKSRELRFAQEHTAKQNSPLGLLSSWLWRSKPFGG
jgi:hypothetical protein